MQDIKCCGLSIIDANALFLQDQRLFKDIWQESEVQKAWELTCSAMNDEQTDTTESEVVTETGKRLIRRLEEDRSANLTQAKQALIDEMSARSGLNEVVRLLLVVPDLGNSPRPGFTSWSKAASTQQW